MRNLESRRKLAVYAGNQGYVEQAAEFLVFCADLQRPGNSCRQHDKPFAGDYTEHFIIATVDVALMAQNLVVAAESVGLCLGYPDQDPEVKPRLPLAVILKEEVYSEEGDAERIALYDEQVREYYRQRTDGGHGVCWSEQVASLPSEKARPHMLQFLAEQGFTAVITPPWRNAAPESRRLNTLAHPESCRCARPASVPGGE